MSRRRVYKALSLPLWALWATAVAAPWAAADLGATQGWEDPEAPLESANPESEAAATLTATPIESERSYSVAHPWYTETPAGPTAFVLDRRANEGAFRLDSYAFTMERPPCLLASRGLTDSLQLSVGFEAQPFKWYRGRMLLAEARWNFLNTDNWSLSVRPAYGQTFWNDRSWKNRPITADLVASRVYDDENKLHLGFGGGINSREYQSSFDPDRERDDGRIAVARLSLAYERRLRRHHGLFFSANPTFTDERRNSASKYDHVTFYGDGSKGESHYTSSHDSVEQHLGLTLGAGYAYSRDWFAAWGGLEAGPALRTSRYTSASTYEHTDSLGSTKTYPSEYSSRSAGLSILGAITAGADFRF